MDTFEPGKLINELELFSGENYEIPAIQLHILHAVIEEDFELVKQKIREGAEIDYIYYDVLEDCYPLIFFAVSSGNYEITKHLIDCGCSASSWYGKNGNYSILERAVELQYLNLCQLLLSAGAKASCFYRNDNLTLSLAIYNGNLDICELLLQNMKPSDMCYEGCNYYKSGKIFRNPLHVCIKEYKPEFFELLLKYEADPNFTNLGMTVLQYLDWCKKNYIDEDDKHDTLMNIYKKYHDI